MTTTKTINRNEYKFVNESFSNYRNWGHKTKLFKNGDLVNESKAIYQNRTWESYQYQSNMKKCVYNLISIELDESKAKYKEDKGIKRMTKKHQVIFDNLCKTSTELMELKELMKTLSFTPKESPKPLGIMKAFLAMGDMLSEKESVEDKVKYKEKIIFATMKANIPGWVVPQNYKSLKTFKEKLDLLAQIESV